MPVKPVPHLVYQAYGSRVYLNQALFSILTFRHFNAHLENKIEIVVYTDQPTHFPDYVVCEPLTQARIKDWRGRYDFEHRLKIEVLRNAATRFQAPILYLDSDTYWAGCADRLLALIDKDKCVMDVFEGNLSPHCHAYLHHFLAQQPQGGALPPKDCPVWIAGVIGFSPKYFALLDEVLTLSDELHDLCYQKEWVEQLAFSYVLSQHATVTAVDGEIIHYWSYNAEARVALQSFFESTTHESQSLLPSLAVAFSHELKNHSLAVNESQSPWHRRIRKLRRSWNKRRLHWRVTCDRLLRKRN